MEPVGFICTDLSLQVRPNVKKRITTAFDSNKKGPLEDSENCFLLKNVSCLLEPHKVTAIIGPSGGGKTTLLRFLAGRLGVKSAYRLKTTGYVEPILSNNISVTGSSSSTKNKHVVRPALVRTEEVFEPTMTVREILESAADFRMRDASFEAKQECVDKVMHMVFLNHCQFCTVGSSQKSSITLGERKRLSIATELLVGCPCLLLDEPTSNLDTPTALDLMRTLRNAKESGLVHTVVCTLHQPSDLMLSLVDNVLLLASGTVIASFRNPVRAPDAMDTILRLNGYVLLNPVFNYHMKKNKSVNRDVDALGRSGRDFVNTSKFSENFDAFNDRKNDSDEKIGDFGNLFRESTAEMLIKCVDIQEDSSSFPSIVKPPSDNSIVSVEDDKNNILDTPETSESVVNFTSLRTDILSSYPLEESQTINNAVDAPPLVPWTCRSKSDVYKLKSLVDHSAAELEDQLIVQKHKLNWQEESLKNWNGQYRIKHEYNPLVLFENVYRLILNLVVGKWRNLEVFIWVFAVSMYACVVGGTLFNTGTVSHIVPGVDKLTAQFFESDAYNTFFYKDGGAEYQPIFRNLKYGSKGPSFDLVNDSLVSIYTTELQNPSKKYSTSIEKSNSTEFKNRGSPLGFTTTSTPTLLDNICAKAQALPSVVFGVITSPSIWYWLHTTLMCMSDTFSPGNGPAAVNPSYFLYQKWNTSAYQNDVRSLFQAPPVVPSEWTRGKFMTPSLFATDVTTLVNDASFLAKNISIVLTAKSCDLYKPKPLKYLECILNGLDPPIDVFLTCAGLPPVPPPKKKDAQNPHRNNMLVDFLSDIFPSEVDEVKLEEDKKDVLKNSSHFAPTRSLETAPEEVPGKQISSLLSAAKFSLNAGIGVFFSVGPFWYVTFECFMNMETNRAIKNREIYSKQYKHRDWFISSTLVSFFCITLYCVVYCTIAFFLLGFPPFFYPKYIYSSIVFTLASYSSAIAIRSVCRKQRHAFILYPFFIILGVINCSLFVRDADVPGWFAWTGYLTPYRYMYFSCMLGVLPPGGLTGGSVPNEVLLGLMGVASRSYGHALLAMLAQGVGWLLFGWIADRFLYTND